MKTVKDTGAPPAQKTARPSREDAEKAVETLIAFAGDDPAREGLGRTPARVVDAYAEFFAGYGGDPQEILGKTFAEYGDYKDFVLVKNIDFSAHCEHHMVPIIGRAHVAYWPGKYVAGISKLARIVDLYAKRLTMQERLTQQIADALDASLEPQGVAVMIDAVHHCMTMRGVTKCASSTVTSSFTGIFKEDASARVRFMAQITGAAP